MDGITAGYYHDQEQHFTDAAASHQDCHLPNSIAPVSVVSGGQVMELHHGVSSSLITPSSDRFLEDPDPEEASGYMGKYTCPHLGCPFSNYSHGFNSRAKRNSHMVVCLYGNGVVYEHVPADGQMPSAPYINEVVEEFIRGVAARNRRNNDNNNSVDGPAVEPAPLGSLNTTITAPPPPTTAQDGFQQSAAMGASVCNNFDGIHLTGTQESQQIVKFGVMGAASNFGDEDWLLDYPPSTWSF